ncbi:putrescine-binding periplasmic protein [Escherichia coli H591]|nr:putrescine-binding periplasmic protein [Escherichia coli H591]
MLLYSEQCWPGESSLFLHRADKKICTFIAYLSV